MEKFIKGKQWAEITVGFIKNFCFNPSITLSSGEFLTMAEKFQYGLGVNLLDGKGLNIDQINLIKQKIINIMERINFDSYCRIDLFFNIEENQMDIIEINSLPALTPATVLYQQGGLEGLTQQQLLEIIILNDLLRKLKK
jgi:D-alanine-D-alanine ligase